MDYEKLMEIIKQRRTTRVYKPDSIPEEFIHKVIEAARWAPTGANTQPFEFVVVKDKEVKEQINNVFSESSMITRKEPGVSSVVKRTFLEVAPVLIIILGDPRFQEAYPRGGHREEIFHASLSAAVQNMHLAATSLGLGGSVWVTVSPLANMKIKELLHIPQVFTIKTIMPLGYPKSHPSPPAKREPILHEGSYDISKFKTEDEVQETIEKTATQKGKLSYRRSF
jgi:5,6-dimethylbenzimidazole synthase